MSEVVVLQRYSPVWKEGDPKDKREALAEVLIIFANAIKDDESIDITDGGHRIDLVLEANRDNSIRNFILRLVKLN